MRDTRKSYLGASKADSADGAVFPAGALEDKGGALTSAGRSGGTVPATRRRPKPWLEDGGGGVVPARPGALLGPRKDEAAVFATTRWAFGYHAK